MKTLTKLTGILAVSALMLTAGAAKVQAQNETTLSVFQTAKEDYFYVKCPIMTERYGCAVIGKTNGYKSKSFATNPLNKIKEINNSKKTVDWVTVTPNGKWIIVYDNGKQISYSSGFTTGHAGFLDELKDIKARNVTMVWAVADDIGNFLIKYKRSDGTFGYKYNNNMNSSIIDIFKRNGWKVKSVYMSNSGWVVTYNDNHVEYIGTVPQAVKDHISKFLKMYSTNISSIAFTDMGYVVIVYEGMCFWNWGVG